MHWVGAHKSSTPATAARSRSLTAAWSPLLTGAGLLAARAAPQAPTTRGTSSQTAPRWKGARLCKRPVGRPPRLCLHVTLPSWLLLPWSATCGRVRKVVPLLMARGLGGCGTLRSLCRGRPPLNASLPRSSAAVLSACGQRRQPHGARKRGPACRGGSAYQVPGSPAGARRRSSRRCGRHGARTRRTRWAMTSCGR